jgi:mannose-6-phosphate isomerase
VVYLPARTVHAIGAGILLYELQQTSDVTYRLYDWNRVDAAGKSRELHVDKAQHVLDYHRWTRGKIQPLRQPGDPRTVLIAGPYFCMELIEVGQEAIQISTYNSPIPICALEQPAWVTVDKATVALPRYSSALIPAVAGTYSLRSVDGAKAHCLVAWVPTSTDETRQELIGRGFPIREVDIYLAQFAPVNG